MESSAEPINPLPTPPPRHFVGGVWIIVLALFLLSCGFCSTIFYGVLPFSSDTEVVQTNTIFGALAGFGILFGAACLWQGIATVRGRAPPMVTRVFPRSAFFFIAFFGAIALGMSTLALGASGIGKSIAAYVFPFWHFIAAAAPAFALIAYAARRIGNVSSVRGVMLAFGWGALGATMLSLILEVVVAVTLVVVAVVVISLAPGGAATLEQLRVELQRAQSRNDLASLTRWVTHPGVIAGALFYLAVIVPLAEETFKTLALGLIAKQARWNDVLLWGLSAGAGFAVMENLFNASPVLSAWGIVIVMRAGTTIMHMANGAWMARGWHAARVERRWGKLIQAYSISVLNHAAWNAAALVLSGSVIFFTERQTPLVVLMAALGVVLFTLASLGWVSIVYAVRRAQSESAA